MSYANAQTIQSSSGSLYRRPLSPEPKNTRRELTKQKMQQSDKSGSRSLYDTKITIALF
jgi:hypothetical protein